MPLPSVLALTPPRAVTVKRHRRAALRLPSEHFGRQNRLTILFPMLMSLGYNDLPPDLKSSGRIGVRTGLLDVTGLRHHLLCLTLGAIKCGINSLLTRNSRGDRLTDNGADRLKFRDRYELDPCIGNRVLGRLGWISRLDRLENGLGKRRRLL